MVIRNAFFMLFGGSVVYVALAACSAASAPRSAAGGSGAPAPGPVAEAQAQSGTRLRARWMVGADGSRQFVGWWDSVRSEECAFTLASSMRCTPGGAAPARADDYVLGHVETD